MLSSLLKAVVVEVVSLSVLVMGTCSCCAWKKKEENG